MTPETALVTAAAIHFGFQTTVTALVYPALSRVPAEQWASAHRAHSRGITPVVAVVYGALALTGVWSLFSGPGGWTLAALAAVGLTVLVTAAIAAPAHGRLANGRDEQELNRLLAADRIRASGATLALVAAAIAAP